MKYYPFWVNYKIKYQIMKKTINQKKLISIKRENTLKKNSHKAFILHLMNYLLNQ